MHILFQRNIGEGRQHINIDTDTNTNTNIFGKTQGWENTLTHTHTFWEKNTRVGRERE